MGDQAPGNTALLLCDSKPRKDVCAMSECSLNGVVAGQAALLVTAAPVSSIAVDDCFRAKHLNELFVRETID